MPTLWGTHWSTAMPYEKTRMVWLHYGVKSLRICWALSTEYRHVTDGWTDRWLDRHPATA